MSLRFAIIIFLIFLLTSPARSALAQTTAGGAEEKMHKPLHEEEERPAADKEPQDESNEDSAIEPVIEMEPEADSEESDADAFQMETVEPVVVTATRFNTALGNVPATVTVISGEEAKERPMENVDDLLRSEASFTMDRYQGMANAYPFILRLRGIGAQNRTLVLLDGQPIHNAVTGAAALNLLPSERIGRIELVRGPFSALYGSKAMGGVIHLITEPGGKGSNVRLTSGLGMDQTYLVAPSVADGIDWFEYSMAYEGKTTENYLAKSGEANLDYHHHKLHARLDFFRREKYSAKLTGGFYLSKMGFNQYVDLRSREDLDEADRFHIRNEGRSERDNGYGQLEISLKPVKQLELLLIGSSFYERQRFFAVPLVLEGNLPNATVEESEYKAGSYRAELLMRYKPLDWLALTAGYEQIWDIGEWLVYAMRKTEPENDLVRDRRLTGMEATVSGHAGQIQSEFDFLDHRLNIIAGLRLDYHPEYGLAYSPKLGISGKPAKDTTLRASGGMAFRAPTLSELYMPEWHRTGPTMVAVGNEDLKSEVLYSADAGVEQRFGEIFWGRATAFFNYGRDFISLELEDIDDDGDYDQERYRNIDEIYTAGAELELDIKPIRQLTIRPTYTYTWTRDLRAERPLLLTPEHMAGLVLIGRHEWSWGYFVGTFDVRVHGKRYANDPTGAEKRVALDENGLALGNLSLVFGWRNVALFANFYNLWNTQYQETAGVESASFRFLCGLRIEADWPTIKSKQGKD